MSRQDHDLRQREAARMPPKRRLPCVAPRGSGKLAPMPKKKSPRTGTEPVGRAEKSEAPVVIGARVRELYEAKGWTQMEFAWRANVSLPQISRIVLGQRGCGAGVLMRLALTLETSMEYLVGMTDDPRPRR